MPSNQAKVQNVENPLSVAVGMRDADAVQMVREGIAANRTMLAFQPVVQSADPTRPAFYEGLIRVSDASGRIIPARDFIGAVETDELGRQLDCAALRLGLNALKTEPSLRLSINMSARSIGYSEWKRILHRNLRKDPTLGDRLILEITESSAIVVPDLVIAFMSELQDLGIAFALDDFGSGYTSFRHFKDFHFDILKIDGGFIRDIHRSPDQIALVRAALSVAHHFEMLTVAEQVETGEDAAILADIGVDCMQGYYFGIPTTRPYWMQVAARVGA